MYQLGSFQKILLRINDAYDLSASTKNVKSDQNLLSVCGQAVCYTFLIIYHQACYLLPRNANTNTWKKFYTDKKEIYLFLLDYFSKFFFFWENRIFVAVWFEAK